jgi:hypothetical protein
MLAQFLFAAALVASASLLQAEDESDMSRLRIEVRSIYDKPIDRAAVIVKFIEGRSVAKLGKQVIKRWEVRTNQEGVAKLPSMPQGKVRIQVVAKHYQTFGDTFELDEENEVVKIQLNPPQAQFSAHQ